MWSSPWRVCQNNLIEQIICTNTSIAQPNVLSFHSRIAKPLFLSYLTPIHELEAFCIVLAVESTIDINLSIFLLSNGRCWFVTTCHCHSLTTTTREFVYILFAIICVTFLFFLLFAILLAIFFFLSCLSVLLL